MEVPSRMSADIVFVVEEAECVKSESQGLGVLAKNLDSNLRAKGLTDNKFALVSFRSEHADINTIQGDLWTSIDSHDRHVALLNDAGM